MRKNIAHFTPVFLISRMVRLFFVVGFVITAVILFGHKQAPGRSEKQTMLKKDAGTAANIEGAWQLVWGKYDGVEYNTGKPFQFKIFHDGYFSLIAWDSAGKLSSAGYGKYELQANNIYKETFTWSNEPQYIGGWDLQEYELNGDTLRFKGFVKVVIQGQDKTSDFPKIEEIRVRAK